MQLSAFPNDSQSFEQVFSMACSGMKVIVASFYKRQLCLVKLCRSEIETQGYWMGLLYICANNNAVEVSHLLAAPNVLRRLVDLIMLAICAKEHDEIQFQ